MAGPTAGTRQDVRDEPTNAMHVVAAKLVYRYIIPTLNSKSIQMSIHNHVVVPGTHSLKYYYNKAHNLSTYGLDATLLETSKPFIIDMGCYTPREICKQTQYGTDCYDEGFGFCLNGDWPVNEKGLMVDFSGMNELISNFTIKIPVMNSLRSFFITVIVDAVIILLSLVIVNYIQAAKLRGSLEETKLFLAAHGFNNTQFITSNLHQIDSEDPSDQQEDSYYTYWSNLHKSSYFNHLYAVLFSEMTILETVLMVIESILPILFFILLPQSQSVCPSITYSSFDHPEKLLEGHHLINALHPENLLNPKTGNRVTVEVVNQIEVKKVYAVKVTPLKSDRVEKCCKDAPYPDFYDEKDSVSNQFLSTDWKPCWPTCNKRIRKTLKFNLTNEEWEWQRGKILGVKVDGVNQLIGHQIPAYNELFGSAYGILVRGNTMLKAPASFPTLIGNYLFDLKPITDPKVIRSVSTHEDWMNSDSASIMIFSDAFSIFSTQEYDVLLEFTDAPYYNDNNKFVTLCETFEDVKHCLICANTTTVLTQMIDSQNIGEKLAAGNGTCNNVYFNNNQLMILGKVICNEDGSQSLLNDFTKVSILSDIPSHELERSNISQLNDNPESGHYIYIPQTESSNSNNSTMIIIVVACILVMSIFVILLISWFCKKMRSEEEKNKIEINMQADLDKTLLEDRQSELQRAKDLIKKYDSQDQIETLPVVD